MVILAQCCSDLQIQMQHERSPIHIQSSFDLSYGNHWNQGSNKQRVLLSQSIRNQSGQSLNSYSLEVKPFHICHILLYLQNPLFSPKLRMSVWSFYTCSLYVHLLRALALVSAMFCRFLSLSKNPASRSNWL